MACRMCLRDEAALVRIVAHRVEHLGGDHHPVARRAEILQRAAQDLFAHAERIHVRGVEKIDAQLERAPDERAALFLFEHPLPPTLRAVSHGAEANPRNLQAGRTEIDVIHILLRYHCARG